MKKTIAIALAIALVSQAVFAQAAPRKVLTDADIKKLVQDLPKISPELDAIDMDFEQTEDGQPMSVGQLRGMFDTMKADARVKKVLAKYGWNDSFFEKFYAIMVGYTALMLEQGLAQVETELASSTDYTEEQKAMMKEQMAPMLQQMRDMASEYRKAVHADDMKTIERNKPALDQAFDEGEDE